MSEERRTYSYHGRNKGGGGGGGEKMAEEESKCIKAESRVSKWSQVYQSRVKCIKVESSVLKSSVSEKAQEHLHVDVESVEPAL